MLRQITAEDVTFWQAFEEVEGPIGYGQLVRALAWLGWLQCDGEKITPEQAYEWLRAFVCDPDGRDEDVETEHTQEQSQAEIHARFMQMFPPDK